MAPWLAVFIDPIDAESAMYNNFRLFGTGLLCIMGKRVVDKHICWLYMTEISFRNNRLYWR